MKFSSAILLIFHTILSPILAESGNDVKNLLREIYTVQGYNKNIRPLIDQTQVVEIFVDFFLRSIIDFDERTESLKTTGFLGIHWQDQYFTWKPSVYNNTETVFVPQNDVWKPDIVLTNSFTTFNGLGSTYLNIQVDHNGSMSWYPSQVLESTCSVSITYFPFDVQTCELMFSAWSYTNKDVAISLGKEGIRLERYVPSASWDLIDSHDENIRNSDEATIAFSLKLKRKPQFYILTIIIPIILLSLLNTFTFMLPVTSGERSGYSITVFLSLAIFLTIVSDQLPKNSEHVSLLAVYIMSVTALSTFIVMLCLTQLRMQSWHDTNKPVNRFFRTFVSLSNFFRCNSCRKVPVAPTDSVSPKPGVKSISRMSGSSSENDMKNEAEQPEVTWLDVINAIDFVFFVASLTYTFICTLVIGVVTVNMS